jgi:hypothetical protein
MTSTSHVEEDQQDQWEDEARAVQLRRLREELDQVEQRGGSRRGDRPVQEHRVGDVDQAPQERREAEDHAACDGARDRRDAPEQDRQGLDADQERLIAFEGRLIRTKVDCVVDGDGVVHIERPRWHLMLCDEEFLTRDLPLTRRPVSCLMCLGLEHLFFAL